jgi:hypothetical protein
MERMVDTVPCPGCNANLTLPAMPPGQTVQCPRCRHVFEPEAQTVVARAPAPASPHPLTAPDEAIDAPLVRDRPGTLQPPVGTWCGYLALLLLAANALSFVLQAVVEVERIMLIDQEALIAEARVLQRRHPIERGAKAVDPDARWLDARWRDWGQFADTARFLLHATLWPALVAFLIWLSQAYGNLTRLSASGLAYTPEWAVGLFLLPIVNLITPFAVIQELWRASHPLATQTPREWRGTSCAMIVRVWWFLYFGAIVLWLAELFLGAHSDRRREGPTGAWIGFIQSVVAAGAAALLACIVYKIMQRQQERYRRLDEPDV